MIRFACPGCSTVFTVGDDKAGKTGKCPKCPAQFQIPAAEPSAAPPPAVSETEINPCPSCRASIVIVTDDLGLEVECPYCKELFQTVKRGRASRKPSRSD